MQQILNFIVCQIFLFRGVGRRGKGFSFITQCVIYLEVIFAAKRYRFLSIKLFIQLLFFQSCKTSNYCIFLAGNPARYTLVLRHLILMSGTRAVRARVRRPDGGVDWGLLYGAWPGTLALTRAQGGEQRKRVLSLLMWPMMWFISHCSHVNYIPKIQTLFLKEIEQKPALNPWQRFPYLHFFLPQFFFYLSFFSP